MSTTKIFALAILAPLTVLTLGYTLPWLVAYARSHKNTPAIAVLNLLTGWTVVGWVAALVWACTYGKIPNHTQQLPSDPDTPSDKEELKKLVEQARKLPKPRGDIGEETVRALREATAEPTQAEHNSKSQHQPAPHNPEPQ